MLFLRHRSPINMRRLNTIVGHLRVSPCSGGGSVSLSGEGPPSAAWFSAHVRVSSEVSLALKEGRPVVALESTIISHGMPWPANFETALRVEQTARENGATPATIALLGGIIHVGLERAQLEQLARLGTKCAKVSRRDLALVVSSGSNGATTVSATMLVASWVGIAVFATGGIGGVHRGGETSMDVSADLTELGRTPVAVVCAGVKSILDIPRTLEVLETQGVAVAVWRSDEFPAFFTPKSGCSAPSRVNSAGEAAGMIRASARLGLRSGQLIAVPIPAEAAAAAEPTERATNQALAEAEAQRIGGRDITPFLLGRIAELTKGSSLASNIELVVNNVRVGSTIAAELARMRREDAANEAAAAAPARVASSPCVTGTPTAAASPSPRWPSSFGSSPLVIGGSNLDLLGRPLPGTKFLLGTSNPGTLARSYGGVGRNVAEVLGRLQARPWLLSAVGADGDGRNLLAHAREAGVETGAVVTSQKGNGTNTYMAILDEKGDLFTTIADMAVCDEMEPEAHLPPAPVLATAPLVLIDGNVSSAFVSSACARAAALGVPVFFEPTSIEKCVRGVGPLLDGQVTFVSPSAAELLAMNQRVAVEMKGEDAAKHSPSFLGMCRDSFEHNHATEGVEAQARSILSAVVARAHAKGRTVKPAHILLKRGAQGAMIASLMPSASFSSAAAAAAAAPEIVLTHLPPGRLPSPLVNTSGAGDTLVGGCAWALLRAGGAACRGEDLDALRRAVQIGMRAAELTLVSDQSVSPLLSASLLLQRQEAFEREQKDKELARDTAHAGQR
jgi:pseudouridine-5'-phosphate glycosidase/pseudouridine kinase